MKMYSYFVLILSCVSVLSEDNGVRVVSTAQTNSATLSIVSTREVFTRDGQTNLVRNTTTKTGTAQFRYQQFYHDGLLIGSYYTRPDVSGSKTEAGSPYSISLSFDSSKEVKFAIIGTKDGNVVDAFTCANGIFSPAENSVVRFQNDFNVERKRLIAAAHTGKISPEELDRGMIELAKKHPDQ